MRTSFPIICTLMLIGQWLIAQPTGDDSQPWEMVKEDQHLMVYARKAEHSKIKEIKVETEVTGSLSSVIAVLRDIDAYPDWIYNLKSARQLPQATAQENFYYSEIKFPWPLSNRDYIARSQLVQDTLSRAITIDVVGLPEELPKNKGIVRIPEMRINWELTPIDSNRVKIMYHLHSDPGGSVPAWLINMFVDEGPTRSIRNLRSMLEKEKYQLAVLPDIRN